MLDTIYFLIVLITFSGQNYFIIHFGLTDEMRDGFTPIGDYFHFGAGLENFMHEPNTITTRRRIHDLITESLVRWEPRLVLERVEVHELPDEPARLRVEISYRLRRTGLAQQMGLTMELEA